MEGEMDVLVHLGVFIIKSEVFKTNWCYYLTALEEKTTCLNGKMGATKIMDHCTL